MMRSIKLFLCAALAVACSSLFAYNGGYENSLTTNTTIGGVTYKGYGNNTLTARTESGTTIAANAYAQCKKLKSVNLANVTSIGNAAFAYSALESVTIPATVTTMGYIAFAGCPNLTAATVNGFGWYKANTEPFRDCTKLTTLVANCAPPSLDKTAFKALFASVTTVKVPSAQKSAWSAKGYGVTVQEVELTYSVCYHKNDGTATTANQTIAVGASKALLWKDSGLGWANPSGKTFLGWATSATSGLVKYANGATVKNLTTAGKVFDLYAVWYDSKTDYIVKYFRNTSGSDTTVAQQCMKRGVSSALAWKDSGLGWANPSGKTFVGWGAAASATVAKYANGQSGVKDLAAAGQTVNLYAVWRPANTYIVTFHRNMPGGDTTTANQWISRGTSTALAWKDSGLGWANPSGYSFSGWSETASGAVKYSNGQKVTDLAAANGTKHLYAKWKANTYTVRYHYNCGSDDRTTDQSFTYGAGQCLKWVDSGLKWPHPQSASFLGWAETANGAKKYANGQSVKNLTTANNGVVHLYAKWNLITVRFHKNTGGTDVTAFQYFKPDVAQSLTWKDSGLKWTTPSGKLFVGWGLKANAPVANYANGASVKNPTSAGNTLDLYAIWAAADSYIVKLYRNHSSTDATVAYQGVLCAGGSLAWKDSGLGWTNPSGKTFLGWSKSRTATTATYKNGATVTGLAAKGSTVALYAVWSTPKKSAAARGEVTFSSLQNKVLPAAPQSAVLTWAPGYYRGLFADDAGTFDLLLGEFDEDGVADAYFAAQTADGLWTEECEVEVVGETLVLTFDERMIIIRSENGLYTVEIVR